MTSTEIRQSFLDFFREKQHTIVPSSSLLPDAPNLLFTNAGMNQFVPIFLGQQKPLWTPPRVADTQKCIRAGGKHNDLEDVGLDTYHHTFFEMLGNWSFGDYFKKEAIEWAWELVVNRWKFPAQRLYATVYCPDSAQGHWDRLFQWVSDLATTGAVKTWGSTDYQNLFYGPNALATKLGLKENPDLESAYWWATLFIASDLDPKKHIVPGGRTDNFWMMGDTGPCGPCSELHVDLTADESGRELVNKNDPRCIEIWNLVFIQFNANPDGTFTPLPQRHVDTGMGFERTTAIIQGTRNLTDFGGTVSNYETDIFRPIFDEIEKLSGKKYASTLPKLRSISESEQQKIDIAFRVIADHIRALSFAIADGILPSNEGRGYVLRRILRRAVRYGRNLGFHEPFFFKLVDVLAKTMDDVFSELRAKQKTIQETIKREEESFNKTLDAGIGMFERIATDWLQLQNLGRAIEPLIEKVEQIDESSEPYDRILHEQRPMVLSITELLKGFKTDLLFKIAYSTDPLRNEGKRERLSDMFYIFSFVSDGQKLADLNKALEADLPSSVYGNLIEEYADAIADVSRGAAVLRKHRSMLPGEVPFLLYDTYGFPLDLTQLMARERGLTVDVAGFEKLMKEQRDRARRAQKKDSIEIANVQPLWGPTRFVGYDHLSSDGGHFILDNDLLYVEASPFYAEMGGQVGDTGWVESSTGARTRVISTLRTSGGVHVLKLADPEIFGPGDSIPSRYMVDADRRRAIERHHTVTHVLHWALHQVVSRDASQKGSYVGPDKLTLDFSSAPLTKPQVRDVEKLVNEKIAENAPVSWTEISYAEAKKRSDIIQFFGEKYGDAVRVLQIGGAPHALNGYSMELCGGTHVRSTSEIGPFRIVKEEAIAAGIRRIEAVAGDAARSWAKQEAARQQEKFETLARKKPDISALPAFEREAETAEMLKEIDARAAHLEKIETEVRDWEKQSTKAAEAELRSRAAQIANQLAASHAGKSFCVAEVQGGDGKLLQAVADALKSKFNGPIFLVGAADDSVALVAFVPKEMTSKFQANKLIQQIAPIVGGKGGGRPENAQGAGKDASKISEALANAEELLR
jgi:alanyl-tRNA synthetase